MARALHACFTQHTAGAGSLKTLHEPQPFVFSNEAGLRVERLPRHEAAQVNTGAQLNDAVINAPDDLMVFPRSVTLTIGSSATVGQIGDVVVGGRRVLPTRATSSMPNLVPSAHV